MVLERTSVGLDVHARSIVAGVIDGLTGEIRSERLAPTSEAVVGWGHCCIEPECAAEAQESGGSPSWKGAKKGSNHSTMPMICRLERRSGGSRTG
jgi:hypothetical protein